VNESWVQRRKVAKLSERGQKVSLSVPDSFDVEVPDTSVHAEDALPEETVLCGETPRVSSG
jgi:hypothetical protein